MAKSGQKGATPGHIKTEVAVTANVRSADILEITQADRDAAEQLGIDLGESIAACLKRAAVAANEAALRAVEAGFLLMRVKQETGHGAFQDALDEIGMSRQRASEFMRMARFMSLLPEEKRQAVISTGKKKVLALAGAEKEIIDVIVDEGVEAIDALTVKGLQSRIRQLEADNTNLTVERDTSRAELAATKKSQGNEVREDAVPMVIADLRSEVVALGKKASLAVDGFNPLGRDIVNLLGSDAAYMWADATLRLALAQLAAIGLQVEGLLKSFKDALGDDGAGAVEMSYLSRQEIVEAAQKFKELIAEHEHEAALRAWEREQERPRDKGRPRSKPEAPAKSRKG